MPVSAAAGSPSIAPKIVAETAETPATPSVVTAEPVAQPPPDSEVRAQYHRDEYRAPAVDTGALPPTQRRELPVADAVALRKELGPEKFAQIQNLIFLANSTGPTSPATLKALATLINENKGEFLKNLIPFMKAGSDLGDAFGGRDAAGQPMTGGQRLWSFFKGLLGAAIDASTLGAGGRALAGLNHAYRAAQAVDGAEMVTRYAPILAALSKNGADPEVVAQLLELAKKPTVIERMTSGVEAAVTNPAAPVAPADPQNAGG